VPGSLPHAEPSLADYDDRSNIAQLAPGGSKPMGHGVRLAIEDGIARVTLDDGKVNAMSSVMLAEIGEALDAAERAGAVTVLSGREGMFSAGFDLPTFQRGRDASVAMVRAGAELVARLLAFPRPVLTVCTGHAYPMGAFLMLAADVRFGVAGPWRIGLNETAIGITVPKFAVELARHRLSPPGFARVASAALFAPDDALRLGYLDRVLSAGELASAVEEEARRLRALDAPSFVATKARINERALHAVRTAIEAEMRAAAA
jgi:enoyl-CoA hydratase